MRLTNIRMDAMLSSALKVLGHRDMVGYAAARNVRVLREELSEYHMTRDALIRKHGEPGDGGPDDWSISPASPGWAAFVEELDPYSVIEHAAEVFTIPVEEAIGKLSGEEILSLDWMLDEGQE